MDHNLKYKKQISLLLIFCFCLLIGCKGKIIGVDKQLAINYDTKTWEYITDGDDIKKLSIKMLQMTQIDLPDTNYTVELILLKPKMIKRKNIGVYGLKMNISPQYREVIRRQGFFKASKIKSPDWYTVNFKNTTSRTLTLANKEFFILERESQYKDLKLKQNLAFYVENDRLYLFGIYSPEAEYEKSTQEFLALLESINFINNEVQFAIQAQQAGFFTGLVHGAFWLFLWIISWFHYYDVWPDHNSGFGFTIGFILGPILAAFIRGFYNAIINNKYGS